MKAGTRRELLCAIQLLNRIEITDRGLEIEKRALTNRLESMLPRLKDAEPVADELHVTFKDGRNLDVVLADYQERDHGDRSDLHPIVLFVPRSGPCQDGWSWYLERAHGDRTLGLDDVDPSEFRRLLPWVALVERIGPIPDGRFRIRVAGDEVCQLFGTQMAGRYLDELPLRDWKEYWHIQYRSCIARGEPVFDTVPLEWADRDFLMVEYLLLPVVDRHGEVQRVLTFMSTLSRTKIAA